LNRAAAISLIILVTAATFGRAVGNDYVSWDDRDTIAENPRVKEPSYDNVAYYWSHSSGGLYAPVTYSYWAALSWLARGVDPRVYHAASVVLHACAALLVFAVVRQLVASDAAACAGALLFAVHPVQVESVAWASGAKDLLAGLFSLAMIDQFLRFTAKRQAGGGRAQGFGRAPRLRRSDQAARRPWVSTGAGAAGSASCAAAGVASRISWAMPAIRV